MPKFLLTVEAKADLKRIGIYTKNTWGISQKNRYLGILNEAFFDIANKPKIGAKCDYINPEYRKFDIGKHIIFYKEINFDTVKIIRILHEKMDILTRLH
jgi:toxin ParE1/3/4